jgi:hypothetical protein
MLKSCGVNSSKFKLHKKLFQNSLKNSFFELKPTDEMKTIVCCLICNILIDQITFLPTYVFNKDRAKNISLSFFKDWSQVVPI